VVIDPSGITVSGLILAVGGAGGTGSIVGAGGAGGAMTLSAPGGTVTFINGGWDLSGGLGSPAGASGLVTVDGTLVFAFLRDVFQIPEAAQAIGTTVKELLATTSKNEDTSTPDSDKKKKGSASSCKP
jgi:hypothetical protein